jgi:hypothetical protein
MVNTFNCRVDIKEIRNFQTGFKMVGNDFACAWNKVTFNHFANNKIGLHIAPAGTTGYVNENSFFAGRIDYFSGEGSNVSGGKFLYIENPNVNVPNNNRFYDIGLEGDGPEYNIHCQGRDNHFINCRLEAWQAIAWDGTDCFSNMLLGGVIPTNYATKVVHLNSAPVNTIRDSYFGTYPGSHATYPAWRYLNTNGINEPISGWYDNTHDLINDQEDWGIAIFPRRMDFKWPTDAEPQLRVNAATGQLFFGPGGSTAPVAYLEYLTAGALDGVKLVDGCIALHVHTDATRGAAGTAGRVIFNSDDANLNIDDGTNWILPNGTTT